MKRALCSLLTLLLVSPAALAINVVTSIKPIQLIVLEITKGVTVPELLVNSTASPHDYALKPSDVKKVIRADLVIWFGDDLESFLIKVIEKQKSHLALSQSPLLTLNSYSVSDHDAHHGHDHGAGSVDPHIWLGPDQAKQSAMIIADRLSEVDPANADKYQSNYQVFISTLDKKVSDIVHSLMPYKEAGFFVFHDGYGYFEQQFGLNKVGYFTLSPERKPGAKTLIQIQTALRSGSAKCVFTEPQFKPSIVKSVTRGTSVAIGELDPLATNIKAESGGYFVFLEDLTQRYVQCLSAP